MNKILLDTNAYTSYLSGDEKVLEVLSRAKIVYISVIVLGELYSGFKSGNREEKNKKLLRNFINKLTVDVIEVSEETAEIFGEIKSYLKKNGTPIPINDIWIASNSVETGSVLITYDKHFKKVSGLRCWDEL